MRVRTLLSIWPLVGTVLADDQYDSQTHSVTASGQNDTLYDYIIVGAGPTGIVMADRLSEAGKRVLLIERGGPSTAETGGADIPTWANGTQLTRFDIPGLFLSLYSRSVGRYWWCNDVNTRAGCLVGGGAAINGILYWYPTDFEYSTSNGWPSGWQSVSEYLGKVKARLPSTNNPSRDGKFYLDQMYDVLGSLLDKQGYTGIVANDERNRKDRVYSHSNYYIQNGKRTGPMDTYLKTAKARPNFKLLTYTKVLSVLRNGDHITGVQTNDTTIGNNGAINLSSANGRVILSAGVFGTSRILYQSGIGPSDMLSIAAASSFVAKYMPPSSQYINLPVGMNVTDNPSVSVTFTHPSVDAYNWADVATNPHPADVNQYISDQSGVLTSPSTRANFWRAYQGSDGRTRYIQGSCRTGGSVPVGSSFNASNAFSCSIYVGTGLTSVGRIGIDSSMNGTILTNPWLNDPEDKTALTNGLSDFISTYQQVPGLQLVTPNITSVASEDYVAKTVGGSNHWVGSTRIGTDPSTSVVDTNAKVWNTKNLFIVDAGIYPGVATGNPTGSLMVMSEMAVDKIIKLPGGP